MTRAELTEKIDRWRVVIDRATDADTLRNELVHAVDLAEKLAGLASAGDLEKLGA